jgi:hypothetical protein
MNNTFLDVQVAQSSTKLHENAPNSGFFDLVLLFRLGKDKVCKRVAVKELHDNVDVLAICE